MTTEMLATDDLGLGDVDNSVQHIPEHTLDANQLNAIALCTDASKRLVAVTGPAGAGKTYIIRQVYETLLAKGITAALAAPTGKAARRIKEATGIEAVTIHKLLEYNRPGERDEKTGKPLDHTRPKRTRENPLNQSVILVDEYAMVNYELHNNLIAALPSGGKLCAFGDISQLPPIEPYEYKNNDDTRTPFQKLLERPDVVTLDKVYRQGEGSTILQAADQVRRGHTPRVNVDLGDFYVKFTDKPNDDLKAYVKKMFEEGVDFRQINNQIITPMKKSWVGTRSLNSMLRNVLNPRPAQVLQLPRHTWDKDELTIGLGDKVVCTANCYDLRGFFERYEEWQDDMKPVSNSFIPTPETKMMLNGETGIVTQIYPDGAIDVDFGDRIVEVPEKYEEYNQDKDSVFDVRPLREIDLAYALTTHKCQGSEFQQVVYVMNKSMYKMLNRQNFYTAMTRARKRAMIFTDQRGFRAAVMSVAS